MVFTRLHAQFEITQSDVCCRCNIQSWYSDEVPVNISRWNISAVTKRDDPKFAWSLLVVPCECCCRTACVDGDDRAGRLVSRPRPGLKLSLQIRMFNKSKRENLIAITQRVSQCHIRASLASKVEPAAVFLWTGLRLVLQPWSGPCMPSPRGTRKYFLYQVLSLPIKPRRSLLWERLSAICFLGSFSPSWALFRCLNSENEAIVDNENIIAVHPRLIGGRDFQFHAGSHTEWIRD